MSETTDKLNVSPSVGIKYDSNKPGLDMVPADFMLELGSLYTMGANKYEKDNWRKGIKYSRVYAALQRHLNAWWLGTDKDDESGLSHLTHAVWNCITLWWYSRHRTEFDDRYKEDNSTGRGDNNHPAD